MNLDDPRAVAMRHRYKLACDEVLARGIPRYSVHPRGRGYTVHDLVPHESIGEAVEGIGWVWWPRPHRLHADHRWYKRKADAAARALALNEAFDRQSHPAEVHTGPL